MLHEQFLLCCFTVCLNGFRYRSNKSIIHLKMQRSNGYYSIRGEGEFESPYDVIQNCMDNPDILKETDGNIIELKEPVVNSKKPTRYTYKDIL